MKIERIYVGAVSTKLRTERGDIVVVVGAGIEGDKYFDLHDEPGQNMTLVEAEEIESFLAECGRSEDLSITRRNLVTRGVKLNDLVGKEFFVGEVKLRGVELCEPCLGLGAALATPSLPAAEVVKRLLHRAGLRADVLSGGVITRGASVKRAA